MSYLQRQLRIVEDTAAQHEVLYLRKAGVDAVVVGQAVDVAVVDDMMADEGQGTGEGVEVD